MVCASRPGSVKGSLSASLSDGVMDGGGLVLPCSPASSLVAPPCAVEASSKHVHLWQQFISNVSIYGDNNSSAMCPYMVITTPGMTNPEHPWPWSRKSPLKAVCTCGWGWVQQCALQWGWGNLTPESLGARRSC